VCGGSEIAALKQKLKDQGSAAEKREAKLRSERDEAVLAARQAAEAKAIVEGKSEAEGRAKAAEAQVAVFKQYILPMHGTRFGSGVPSSAGGAASAASAGSLSSL
jgi:hypothetical protein